MTVVHSEALGVQPLGDGTYATDLQRDWAVGTHPHGGYLLALLTAAARDSAGNDEPLDPLSVSGQFLRAPKTGPALIRVEQLKDGKTLTFVRAYLEQSGRTCAEATITLGRLPAESPAWSDLPEMPVNPPSGAIEVASSDHAEFFGLAEVCDLRLDPASAGFLAGGDTDLPHLRMWVRPRNSRPDILFGLIAGDITMPVTFNLGRIGWSPTVQLTALLRARPANGWLRLVVDCRTVRGQWFDEDTMVIDSLGNLVCQARQLALSPLPDR